MLSIFRKWLSKEAPVVAPVPAPAPPKSRARIPVEALWASKRKPIATDSGASVVFAVDRHLPPGAVPKGAPTLAMDGSLSDITSWASAGLSVNAGYQSFIGYPALSEMDQRPEYRKINDTLSTEATRKWIKLHAAGDQDKADKIARIDAAMKKLNVEAVFRKASRQDAAFGRAHIFIDLGTDDPAELMTPIGDGYNKISSNKCGIKRPIIRLKNIEPVWCYPTSYNSNDPLSPDWYKPSAWFVQGKQVHSSRILTMVGREVPDLLKPAYSFGGLSLTQLCKPYVENFIRTRQSVSDMVHSYSFNGIKTNLGVTTQMDGDQLFTRAQLFNNFRDNSGLMMLDKDTEEFFNVSVPLGGLDALNAQAQEQMSSVSSIPLIKLLGITPSGLNASSDGELRCFYDYIAAYQEHFFTEELDRIFGFIQLSEFGETDPEITYSFEPLWSLDKKEQAEVRKIEADTAQVYIDAGVLSPMEERKRVAADAETPYASLDVEDAPDLLDEEEQGLEPVGGRPDPAATEQQQPGEPGKPGQAPQAKPPQQPGATNNIGTVHVHGQDAEFEGGKHPRDKDGKFGFGNNASQNVKTAVKYVQSKGVNAAAYSDPKRRTGAAYSPHQNMVGINKNATVANTAAINKQVFGKNKDMDFWQSPEMWTKQQHSTGWLSSDNPFHTLDHEIGHAKYEAPDNWTSDDHADLVKKHVSEYGSKNPNEFAAEYHAGKEAGKSYPPEVDDLFSHYAKPRESKKAADGDFEDAADVHAR